MTVTPAFPRQSGQNPAEDSEDEQHGSAGEAERGTTRTYKLSYSTDDEIKNEETARIRRGQPYSQQPKANGSYVDTNN